MRMIGLTGKARAGKDTVGGLIATWGERQGFKVERDAFANKLKVSAARSLGFKGDAEECVKFCDELKQSGMDIQLIRRGPDGAELEASLSGRKFLQLYGTEAHRDVFDPEFWVDALLDEVLPHGPDDPRFGTILVISDVRFENEARAIHNCEGEIWEVVRDENPDALQNDLNAHVSEVGIPEDLIDFTIHNSSDLEHLDREVGLACLERGVR